MGDLLHEFYKSSFKVDALLAPGKAVIRKEMARYRDDLIRAKRFVLGDDSLRHIVIRGTEDHTKLPDRVPLACLPFDTVWIEYDNHARIRAQHEIGTSDLPDDITPKRAGFLLKRVCDRPTAWTATKVFDTRSGLSGLSAMVYLFDAESDRSIHVLGNRMNMVDRAVPEGTTPEELLEKKRILNYPLWGYAQHSSHTEMLDKLFNHAAYSMEPTWFGVMEEMMASGKWNTKTGERVIAEAVRENAGDLRFLTTALAFINEVPVVYTDKTRQGSFLAGGRQQNFFSNSVITLNIPAMKRRTVMQILDKAARGAKKKRHQVRGHWRVSDKPHGPRWQQFTDSESGRTGYRMWIEHHLRGDAALGWVHQQYAVKHQKGT
jgi:hypothetical protein